MKELEKIRIDLQKYVTDENFLDVYDKCRNEINNVLLYEYALVELYWNDRNEKVSANDPEIIALAKKVSEMDTTKFLKTGMYSKDESLLAAMMDKTESYSRLYFKVKKLSHENHSLSMSVPQARDIIKNTDLHRNHKIIVEKVRDMGL